jgi:dipeptidase E
MKNIILTSSFGTVAQELFQQDQLPTAPRRIAFIITAGNIYDETPWIENDRKSLEGLGYTINDIDFEDYPDAAKLRVALADSDIIFVAGGNTTYLNEYAQRSGFSKLVHDLLDEGKIYIGSSAGSILAGPSVAPFAEEDAQELPAGFIVHNPTCLNLVPYVVLPHYPTYASQSDHIADSCKDQFAFAKLTDHEYRLETEIKRDA